MASVISISNYENGQKLTNRIAVVKGYLENIRECDSALELKCTVKGENCRPGGTLAPYVLLGNRFSVICKLRGIGVNTITILVRHKEKKVDGICKVVDKGSISLQLIYEEPVKSVVLKPMIVYCAEESDPEVLVKIRSKVEGIKIGMKLVQSYYSDQLWENGFGRKTFGFSEDVVEYPWQMKKANLLDLDTDAAFQELAKALLKEHSNTNEVYIAFVAHPWKTLLEESPDNANPQCPLAMANSGLAVVPLQVSNTWPENIEKIPMRCNDKQKIRNDLLRSLGPKIMTAGSLFSATLGCLAHEIGHIFDLGHSEDGLMGRDYPCFAAFVMPYAKKVIKLSSDDASMLMPTKMRELRVVNFNGKLKPNRVKVTRCAAAWLYNHKAFQHKAGGSDAFRLEMLGNVLTSTVGLAAVELRDLKESKVISGFVFDGCSKCFKFPLDKRNIPVDFKDSTIEIHAEDKDGNILKHNIAVNNVPTSTFTKLALY